MYDISGLSYRPHENMEWFTRSTFGGRLVQGGYIRVLTDIKGDELFSQIDLENKILQLDGKDCAWTPNQIIKLSEKLAKVKTYKINLEQCIDELESKRTMYMLTPGAQNEALPDDLEEATLALIAIGLSNEIEEMVVNGDESKDPNQINGMVKILLESTEAIQIAGDAFTEANVLAQLKAAYDAVPEDVLQAEDAGILNMFISYKTRRIARNALADKTNQVLFPMWTVDDADKKNPKLYYNNVELVPVKGMDNNTAVIIAANNAFLLTDLMSDLENIELGQFPKPNESKIFIKGKLRLGFEIPFEDEAVIISASIATDRLDGYTNDDLRITPTNLIFDVAGETKQFIVATKDAAAAITVNGAKSGFTVTKGTTTAGITTVTVTATDATGSINPVTGQVLVSIDGKDRSATVMLEQRNDNGNTVVEE